MQSLEEFEGKLKINTKAYEQIKKFVEEFKPTEASINISTAFTMEGFMRWGDDLFDNEEIKVEVESWGQYQGIFITGRNKRGIWLPRIKLSIDEYGAGKIYENCKKLYQQITR